MLFISNALFFFLHVILTQKKDLFFLFTPRKPAHVATRYKTAVGIIEAVINPIC